MLNDLLRIGLPNDKSYFNTTNTSLKYVESSGVFSSRLPCDIPEHHTFRPKEW